ncbi:MAG: SPOR domain-containing protein [Bacteroidota bacterium]
MQLDALIGELLLRNNCVVVPKFGGFIATRLPASLDLTSGRMQAPKKSILFNKQLTNSDGLLISAYAAKNACSYDAAGDAIDELVKSWFEELGSGKRITFEKVGFLYLDNEKNIRFEQDRFFNLLLQSFGMSQVQFVSEQNIDVQEASISTPAASAPATEKTAETPVITLIPVNPAKEKNPVKREDLLPQQSETNIPEGETPVIPISKKQPSRRRISRYVAAACILPIAFYSVWIPMKTDVLESGMFSFQDFNPFHEQSEGTYIQQKFSSKLPVIPQMKSLDAIISKLPEGVSVYPLEFENEDLGESNDLFYIRIREKDEAEAEKNAVSENVSVEKNTTASVEKTVVLPKKTAHSNGKFKVVAGSFSNENNASALRNELHTKGFSAFTMEDSNGLVRVIAGASDSSSEANEIVNRLQQNGVASWILK